MNEEMNLIKTNKRIFTRIFTCKWLWMLTVDIYGHSCHHNYEHDHHCQTQRDDVLKHVIRIQNRTSTNLWEILRNSFDTSDLSKSQHLAKKRYGKIFL